MTKEEVLSILESEELSNEEKSKKIFKLHGQSLNSSKEESDKYKAEAESLKAKVQELETNASKFKDYDELKNFKDTTLKEKEDQKHYSYLEKNGCKYPKLIAKEVDWSSAKWNEKTGTYDGLDIKDLKEQYGDMFAENTSGASFQIGGGSDKKTTDSNDIMNKFLHGGK